MSLIRSPNFRLALSLSLMLFLHRILHRFFIRLRANLRTEDARPFRERNPRVAAALTSRYAPAIGASVAGFALGILPNRRLRITVAIYTATKSLEFLYNAVDERGWLEKRPWWFGSWLLMPVSVAQLFHAFIYDRETTPGVSDFSFHQTIRIISVLTISGRYSFLATSFSDCLQATSQEDQMSFLPTSIGRTSLKLLIHLQQLGT